MEMPESFAAKIREDFQKFEPEIIPKHGGGFLKCPCCDGEILIAMLSCMGGRMACCGLFIKGEDLNNLPPGITEGWGYSKHEFNAIKN